MYRIKRFSKEKEKGSESSNKAKAALGITSIGIGSKFLKDSNKEGEITGRVNLHHNATRSSARRIKREGILGSHSKDKNNLTNLTLDDAGIKDNRNLIYTSRDKKLAENVGKKRLDKSTPNLDPKRSENLKISLPYDEYKNLRAEGNPETHNAKTYKEFLKKEGKPDSKDLRKKWKDIGGDRSSRTVLLEGNVSSKYIKGSKDYQRNSLKEIGRYIKKNPGRFAKGVGKAGLGLGLVAGGSKLSSEGINENKKISDPLVYSGALGLGANTAISGIKSSEEDRKLIDNWIDSKKGKDSVNIRNEANKLVSDPRYNPNVKNIRDRYNLATGDVMKTLESSRKSEDKFVKKAREVSDKSLKSKKAKSVGKGLLTIAGVIGSYELLKKLGRRKDEK